VGVNFFVEIQLPFICHFNEEGAEGPQNGPKGPPALRRS